MAQQWIDNVQILIQQSWTRVGSIHGLGRVTGQTCCGSDF